MLPEISGKNRRKIEVLPCFAKDSSAFDPMRDPLVPLDVLLRQGTRPALPVWARSLNLSTTFIFFS
jgi:hypothetical protein